MPADGAVRHAQRIGGARHAARARGGGEGLEDLHRREPANHGCDLASQVMAKQVDCPAMPARPILGRTRTGRCEAGAQRGDPHEAAIEDQRQAPRRRCRA
ncbi:protein of unknown function (plasmid) [Cupriavidus taiwanensis]|uniref:Uncharacterized protein n=1 Tax=Cupriavidus taiwanensis TaxID=164546 RepID=A0A7Z7NQR9_9BURK|nr:protein of unknown function [Cupriavidus taiwanensis]SOZ12839.1 protein of unknown function [Cupriavidus taiwanensis]SOZ41334.1 protein of unknown function [Cupriavidus taiwanensis]SPC23652.1 protein of unknown function [Cupriavidus taiwanensis]SPD54889.1 protein of unknown function [Cupriavidus taiwanensis]